MKRLVVIVLALLLGTANGSWSVAAEEVLVDQFGREVRIPATPVRLVSLAPSNTEILIELGLGDQIVGVTNWCNYPEVAEVVRVGDIAPVDLEKTVSLQPDLVLAHRLNGKEIVDRLSELGIPVVALNPTSLHQIVESLGIIGQAVGREKEAAALQVRMEGLLRDAEEQGKLIQANSLKVVFYLGEGEPVWLPGPGSFIHEILQLLGTENIAGDSGTEWAAYDLETIIGRNPDVIFVGFDPESLLSDHRWQQVAAVQKGQVYQINSDVFQRAVPKMIESIDHLAELLLQSR